MRLILIRHGEPDYKKDCLTAAGRLQAAACADRLASEQISEIYTSPMGRARETASYTAKKLGLTMTILPFMHEISWGGENIPENGHPWTLSDRMIAEENTNFFLKDWRSHPYFAGNPALMYYDTISTEIDTFLEAQGYRHMGNRFLCAAQKEKTIALFSHGGSGACVLAHTLSLPFPYVLSVMPYDFTSIIILRFEFSPDQYVFPRLQLFNDVAHIGVTDGPFLQHEL